MSLVVYRDMTDDPLCPNCGDPFPDGPTDVDDPTYSSEPCCAGRYSQEDDGGT